MIIQVTRDSWSYNSLNCTCISNHKVTLLKTVVKVVLLFVGGDNIPSFYWGFKFYKSQESRSLQDYSLRPLCLHRK